MSTVPESLTNRLGPLASEANGTAPEAPNSDVRERLETALTPRRQPLESRLGRPNDQNQTSSQISMSASILLRRSLLLQGIHRRVLYLQ